MSVKAKRLIYTEHGDPLQVLKLETIDLKTDIGDDEVLVKWLASPINPSDVHQVGGTYMTKPKLPAVGGNEGVAQVEKVGSGVNSVAVGDWVIPGRPTLGTWQSHAIVKSSEIRKVNNKMPLECAATILVNPPTAYLMLMDYVTLNPGDFVIQNGANSQVGRLVIQIAREKGYKTINIIRARPDVDALKQELITLGADIVLTDEELKNKKDLPTIMLALDCVGGESAFALAEALSTGGKLVNYGGMSKKPVMVSPGHLIFKNISVHGFWLSSHKGGLGKLTEMVQFITSMVLDGKLESPTCELVSVNNYKQAMTIAVSGTGKKQLLTFN